MANPPKMNNQVTRSIWIDLDNSPHVPFFAPIIEQLRTSGYSVLVTARECFQVSELATLLQVECTPIGKHYGKSKAMKIAGLCIRACQLAPTVLREKPRLALSHGSRAQMLLAAALRIPSMAIVDYEFAKGLQILRPRWLMVPEVVAHSVSNSVSQVMQYPGIKEDVYVPRFKPDPSIRKYLGIRDTDFVVTLRPPANEAHYHNPESELLLDEVFKLLSAHQEVKVILLPRNQRQEGIIRKTWEHLFQAGKVLVPPSAVDGLNLIWHSELVISGGGTMNREAAALGVPVYSIFRGPIGAVDRYLARTDRLTLIETAQDVANKILLKRRMSSAGPGSGNVETLRRIVENVVTAVETEGPTR
jgi:predicted glycosyltransferase